MKHELRRKKLEQSNCLCSATETKETLREVIVHSHVHVHWNVSELTVKAILREVHVEHEVIVVQFSISWSFQIIQDVLGTITIAGAIIVHSSHCHLNNMAALLSSCCFSLWT